MAFRKLTTTTTTTTRLIREGGLKTLGHGKETLERRTGLNRTISDTTKEIAQINIMMATKW